MRVQLTRLSSNHKNLRTDIIEGVTEALPAVGEQFLMTAPPLESGDIRIVETTEIIGVLKLSSVSYEFKTRNSHYRLVLL